MGFVGEMSRLVVNDYGVFLGVRGDRIIVKKGGEKAAEVPAGNVSQILIATRGISLSSAFLRLVLKHRIDLVILSGYGAPLGRLVSRRGGAIQLRKNQLAAQNDWRGAHLAKQFGKAKLLNQANLLRSFAKNRRASNPALANALESSARQVLERARGVDAIQQPDNERLRREVMALEADAAEVYWNGIAQLLSGTVGFPGRKKRTDHPADPTNVLLNYGYGILLSEVWTAVEYASLEPYAGFLHADSPRRPALVVDLIEEFRQPVVDRAVLKVLFDQGDKAAGLVDRGFLTSEGRKVVLQALSSRLEDRVTFQDRPLPISAHVLLQARRVGEFLLNRTREYVPFVGRW